MGSRDHGWWENRVTSRPAPRVMPINPPLRAPLPLLTSTSTPHPLPPALQYKYQILKFLLTCLLAYSVSPFTHPPADTLQPRRLGTAPPTANYLPNTNALTRPSILLFSAPFYADISSGRYVYKNRYIYPHSVLGARCSVLLSRNKQTT